MVIPPRIKIIVKLLAPVWKTMLDSPLNGKLSPYQYLKAGEEFKNLWELKVHKNVRKWEI